MREFPTVQCLRCNYQQKIYSKRTLKVSRQCKQCWLQFKKEGVDYVWVSKDRRRIPKSDATSSNSDRIAISRRNKQPNVWDLIHE